MWIIFALLATVFFGARGIILINGHPRKKLIETYYYSCVFCWIYNQYFGCNLVKWKGGMAGLILLLA